MTFAYSEYAARRAQCAWFGHVLVPWLIAGYAPRQLCTRCGLTQVPKAQQRPVAA